MTNFEWFLLIVVVVGVPLVVAVVVTLWTIDQARKRKKQNRPDVQVGVKRKATSPPGKREAPPAAQAERLENDGRRPDVDVSRETSTDRTESDIS